MNPLKPFEEYVRKGVVKKSSKDLLRADFLIKDAENTISGLDEILEKIGINSRNANSIIKSCYDIIMELIRAKMLKEGFNASGYSAHEAEVSYLSNLNFPEPDIIFLNQLRYFRNGIMYYGKLFDKEYGEKVIEFMRRVRKKIK